MRKKALLLLIAFAAFASIEALGALPIKSTALVSSVSPKQEESAKPDIQNNIDTTYPARNSYGRNHKHNHPPIGGDNRPGWPGILALIFGILSVYGGFIPALIFGIKGVNRKYKNRGLALAGLIICVLEVLLVIVLILAFSGVF